MKKGILNRVLQLISVCVLVASFAFGSGCTSPKSGNKFETGSSKSITLKIVSERDGISKSTDYTTKYVYLGDFLESENIISFENSSYGRYIHGADGIMDDSKNEYWWCLYDNDESSQSGVDKVKLTDSGVYTLELKKGYN